MSVKVQLFLKEPTLQVLICKFFRNFATEMSIKYRVNQKIMVLHYCWFHFVYECFWLHIYIVCQRLCDIDASM